MSALEQNLIRIELDVTQYGMPGSLVNLFTGQGPLLARGKAHRLEVVVVKQGVGNVPVIDPDVGNITSVTVEVKTYQAPTSAPLISVTTASINAALDEAARTNRTDQHAVVNFTEGQTGLDMTGANADGFKNFHMVITAVRNGKTVSLAWGPIQMLNDGGVYSGNTPVAGDPAYFTKEEILGLLSGYLKAGLNEPGKAPILVGINGHKWRIGVDENGQRIDRASGP